MRIPEAMSAQVCLYRFDDDNGQRYQYARDVILRGRTARTLSVLLRRAITTRPSDDVCLVDPFVLRLRDRGGDVATYTLAGCFLQRDGAAARLSPAESFAIDDLGGLDIGYRKRRVPDYTGLSLEEAERRARKAHVDLGPSGEVEDATVPLGTVVWQNPLAGTSEEMDPPEVGVYVAVPHAPACRASQLVGASFGGGRGTGLRFGAAGLRNASSRPCKLVGRLSLEGVDRRGHRVTPRLSQPTGDTLVLSPRAPASAFREDPPRSLTVTFGFAGNERDDPNEPDGLCRDLVAPAIWIVRIRGGAVRFVNAGDRDDGPYASCHGEMFSDAELNVIGSTGVHLRGS